MIRLSKSSNVAPDVVASSSSANKNSEDFNPKTHIIFKKSKTIFFMTDRHQTCLETSPQEIYLLAMRCRFKLKYKTNAE